MLVVPKTKCHDTVITNTVHWKSLPVELDEDISVFTVDLLESEVGVL